MSEAQHIPYEPCSLPVPGARAVLVVAPHPDDEVFGCGGCAALYAQAGVPVQALVLTDGGLWGVAPAGLAIADARQAESRSAAGVLGCLPPLFADLADRSLACDDALVDLITRHAQTVGADVLLAPSLWELHPDHRAAAQAAIEAVARLAPGTHLVQYEVGAPLLPNALLDITPVLQLKERAMACFGSQLAMQAYDRHIAALNVYRTYTLPASVHSAEGLRVATAQQARDDPFGLVQRGHAHPLSDFRLRRQTPA
jgi:LmbE family N-acetylglucosaminyl deacetylase